MSDEIYQCDIRRIFDRHAQECKKNLENTFLKTNLDKESVLKAVFSAEILRHQFTMQALSKIFFRFDEAIDLFDEIVSNNCTLSDFFASHILDAPSNSRITFTKAEFKRLHEDLDRSAANCKSALTKWMSCFDDDREGEE